MALGKPSPLSIILAVILVGIIGYLIYVATTNVDTKTENYSKGSDKTEINLTISPTENQLVRCGRFMDLDPSFLANIKKPEKKK